LAGIFSAANIRLEKELQAELQDARVVRSGHAQES
jgi:hypothetical protein